MIHWRKSSWSSTQGGECVELSTNLDDVTLLRDSKNPAAECLELTAAELAAFLGRVKAGRYDSWWEAQWSIAFSGARAVTARVARASVLSCRPTFRT
ncbi:DUF397 domain-containing protein [Spirillospora sp. NPDC047279]|uniref:DUF397 domain-containing protein n=1 Tax=Spirillospora sp. NPDC047279 TaxID=3155478 RepID=UPI00340AC07E